ncbi:MAG TPA: DUF4442 domain-containing protein [Bdellovibrionales bacterium]|nr:DUF4442 domain-containing protein [Pseudobdellovibrionaceae bacterium]HAG91428.1 DUF4442 domain-containing protein [Bdellovibrionales bacterium]|tara:strand:- start:4672 stop:5148 length:477 start_codon:yes stop_codon:yes gene_type:complete
MNIQNLKLTALINGFSLLKIPLLAFVSPQVVELGENRSEVKIRLNYRTKNHLRVMYFGALAMGAELSIALMAVDQIQKKKKRIDFLFKDFEAKFLKRAEGTVHFICLEADQVKALIDEAAETSERLERKFTGHATVPEVSEDPVMTYTLTLSVRNRSK